MTSQQKAAAASAAARHRRAELRRAFKEGRLSLGAVLMHPELQGVRLRDVLPWGFCHTPGRAIPRRAMYGNHPRAQKVAEQAGVPMGLRLRALTADDRRRLVEAWKAEPWHSGRVPYRDQPANRRRWLSDRGIAA